MVNGKGSVKNYRSEFEVEDDRGRGVPLDEILNSLLIHNSFVAYGITPFSMISRPQVGDYVDMTMQSWAFLPVETQRLFALGYQHWYAEKSGLSGIHRLLSDSVPIVLTLIPPMRYWMGLQGGEQKVVLVDKPFWIGRDEITQDQWVGVMGENPSYFQGDPNLPVECVSWEDCQKFCKNTKTKLPTEEQWELACRAGTVETYNFGNDSSLLSNSAWYRENSCDQTHPIGNKEPNAFGLYDMYGNVWEWCQNKFMSSGLARVRRGGCYGSDRLDCASGIRLRGLPSERSSHVGFRVAVPF